MSESHLISSLLSLLSLDRKVIALWLVIVPLIILSNKFYNLSFSTDRQCGPNWQSTSPRIQWKNGCLFPMHEYER